MQALFNAASLSGNVVYFDHGAYLVSSTVNVPANAPHAFRNASSHAARLLCMCTPPGQEVFFSAVGVPVASRTEPAPALDEEAQAAFIAKSKALAPEYRTELLLP